LYWITGNLFTMTQTIVLRKIMEREELQLQKA
jgi:YidC/Oxa1 family membrane protein insertase